METAANSIKTLKNMYKGNNIFLGGMLILQIRNLTNLRCQRRLELDRKKLADTSEPAANNIQTINNYRYEVNNMFLGKTLILQSFEILGVSACWNGLGGGGNGGNKNMAKKCFARLKTVFL